MLGCLLGRNFYSSQTNTGMRRNLGLLTGLPDVHWVRTLPINGGRTSFTWYPLLRSLRRKKIIFYLICL